MLQALIGHTGFVGTNLRHQQTFNSTYNSTNISSIRGERFDRIVCAGVSAVKWWANQNPDADRVRIEALMSDLEHVETDLFTLISTVDVYDAPSNVDENDVPSLDRLHAYGKNRLMLESFVAEKFPHHRIVRLPALFGQGLKKNVIYDLINDNNVGVINPEARFQWYPLARLSDDLALVEKADIRLVNFATEPVSMAEIVKRFFPARKIGVNAAPAALYDFRTRHATMFGGNDGYLMRVPAILYTLKNFLSKGAQQH